MSHGSSPSPAASAANRPQPLPGIGTTELWEAVCRVSADYIAVVDRAGMIRFCNRVDSGWSPDQVVGHSMLDFTLPASAAALRKLMEEVFTTGQPRDIETTVRQPDGSLAYFAVRLGPVIVEGRPAAVLVCCEDILPLKTSEQSLRHERQVLRRLLEIQERERQLVSYEIHDGLSQYLAGALMHLEAHDHAGGPDANPDLREGLRLLRAAADEARQLIGGLRPPALDELGIVAAIESLVAEARLDVASVDFFHRLAAERLPADVETTIFRIVQESLSNVRRHSRAQTAAVVLDQDDSGRVRVVVRDDGVGFAVDAVPEERFGLEGIRQRAQLLGGEARITSAAGHGTTVNVTFPIEPR